MATHAKPIRTGSSHTLSFEKLAPLDFERLCLWLVSREARTPAGRATAIAGKAVHGLDGVGKTRLAIEYCWQHAAEYSALLFVGAGSPALASGGSRRGLKRAPPKG